MAARTTFRQAWPAPAKLNLFLHVTGRRRDGYHELQTVFQFLDFGDRLTFSVTGEDSLQRTGAMAHADAADDLVLRAARALQAAAGIRTGARIHIDKRIPVGGGLGGGSTDAATTLVALNHLWGAEFDDEALAALALPLGADVPVFVRGLAAWGEGVGEALQPVGLPEPWYLVVVPACRVSTGIIFGDPGLTRNTKPIRIPDLFAGGLRNDCEPVARRLYPEVGEALDWLSDYGEARLTGTGACVFAAFADREGAEVALSRLPARWRGIIARGRNESPLKAALAEARRAGDASAAAGSLS